MSSFAPQEFGRYYLVDKIAVGGMAEVFKAKSYAERGFEKLLVIKRILGHLSDNTEFVDMFIDEAKISVELQHANIVQIYDFGKAGDNYYIAMECVEGKDVKSILRKLAQRRKLMPQEYAAFIAHEACKGLDYAHKKTNLSGEPLNIVHRDISPSNVLVSYTGEIKIADFGIAKAQNSVYNTKDGVLKGKFEYMSPEQARGGLVTGQSDVFACGIILHEMLTGRRLFKTDSDVATLELIKSGKYPTPREVNPTVPAALDAVVMRALSSDPAERFADARAFQVALLEQMYPQTPDVIRDHLRLFMEELFADEIAAERERLAAGSRAAEGLRARPKPAPPESWTEAPSQQTAVPPPPAPSRAPLLLAGVAVALLATLVASFTLQAPDVRVVEVDRPAPTTGTLQLVIEPAGAAARVLLDGAEVAQGVSHFTTSDLAPDDGLLLRVEAAGYVAHEEALQVVAGERLRLRVVLKPEPVSAPAPRAPEPGPAPAPAPAPAAEARPAELSATVRFTSNPPGADVKVDGKKVGQTPLTWSSAKAGATHKVEYALSGHETARFSVEVPEGGGAVAADRALKAAQAAAPGTLQVSVRGGWGDVWIDGKKVDQTPYTGKMPAGTYTVRVVNGEAGLDDSRKVTILPGETTRLSL